MPVWDTSCCGPPAASTVVRGPRCPAWTESLRPSGSKQTGRSAGCGAGRRRGCTHHKRAGAQALRGAGGQACRESGRETSNRAGMPAGRAGRRARGGGGGGDTRRALGAGTEGAEGEEGAVLGRQEARRQPPLPHRQRDQRLCAPHTGSRPPLAPSCCAIVPQRCCR